MDDLKSKQRTIIEFLLHKGQNATEIHNDLVQQFGHEAYSYRETARWVKWLKEGRTSLEDKSRSGRPSEGVSQQNLNRVEELVNQDRQITVREIAVDLQLSHSNVHRILQDHLLLEKKFAKWVPKNLSDTDRQRRVQCAQQNLALIKRHGWNFFSQLVTGDETWIKTYDPASRAEAAEWRYADEPPPERFKQVFATKKCMASIFWDSEGILLIDFLPPNTYITGAYYSDLLKKLAKAINKKRPNKIDKKIYLLHDNASPHKSNVVAATIAHHNFTELYHAPYSPDLAPSDYFLFKNLKQELRGTNWEQISDAKSVVKSFFKGKEKNWFFDGLYALGERYEKCIQSGGNYFE